MMFFLIILGILIINRIPIVGQIFKVVSTMFHEIGHAIITILTKGRVYGIVLIKERKRVKVKGLSWKKRIKKFFFEHPLLNNTEGLANVGTRGWLPTVLVTLAGYPSEMGSAILLLYLYVNDKYDLMIYFLIGVALLTLIFLRNRYGFVWMLAFGFTLYLAFHYHEEAWVKYYLLTITLICIVESVYSSFSILILSITDRKNAGDTTILARLTLIPAIIWGLFFFVLNLYFLFLSKELFIALKTAVSSF